MFDFAGGSGSGLGEEWEGVEGGEGETTAPTPSHPTMAAAPVDIKAYVFTHDEEERRR
ncbi:hypothetical protein K525DRAFT_275428 [Schizophyllum commune Loenen D]|nr:hypothetical protein K525DRAFT_275428 [Schizophyllum commune Loenen D]